MFLRRPVRRPAPAMYHIGIKGGRNTNECAIVIVDASLKRDVLALVVPLEVIPSILCDYPAAVVKVRSNGIGVEVLNFLSHLGVAVYAETITYATNPILFGSLYTALMTDWCVSDAELARQVNNLHYDLRGRIQTGDRDDLVVPFMLAVASAMKECPVAENQTSSQTPSPRTFEQARQALLEAIVSEASQPIGRVDAGKCDALCHALMNLGLAETQARPAGVRSGTMEDFLRGKVAP